MANLDISTLSPKIDQAKSAGYSDDEIVNFLSSQAPAKFKQAKDAGYSSSEILGHISKTLPPIVVDEGGDKAKPEAPDDHGLARRQAMSPLEKAVSPVTEYPRNYAEMRDESAHQMGRGVEQLMHPAERAKGDLFPSDIASGIGNVGLGALGYAFSPLSAAYRSVIGQPVEDVTGIPREQTEFAAQLATPGIGFSKLADIPGAPINPSNYRPPTLREPPPPPEMTPGLATQAGAQRLNEAGYATDVPKSITSDNRVVQSAGQYTSNIPVAGNPIGRAVQETLPKQLEGHRTAIANEFGTGTGGNVANRVGINLSEAAAAETKAAEDAAKATDAQATADWQRANQEREAAIAAREQQSTQAAQQGVGPEGAPRDMGETVIDATRAAHNAAETNKNALYREAGSHEGTIFDEAVGRADREISADLRSDGGQGTVTTTPTLTPAAMEMRRSLEAFSNRGRQRLAQAQAEAVNGGGTIEDAAQTGINLRAIETQRQELGNMAQGATNDADRRAARRIMNAFDDWHEAAIGNHFDGDPAALDAYRAARAANRDFRTRFGYNQRDDADKLINKIVRGEEDQHAGPLGVSDALTARNDKSGPLFSRVMEATNGSPDVLQAIRSGTWNKLSRQQPGAERSAQQIRDDIYAHLHGRGQDVAERVFTPEQRNLMHAHADTLLETAAQRAAAPKLEKTSQPVPTKFEPGPMQQLADRVIGKGQRPHDEALFDTISGYARKGGDVKTLARLVQHLPQSMRGDLASTMIRHLGDANRTGNFSLDHFVNQWRDITPQAKAVLFGNAGPHVTALNDIAEIADRLRTVKGRYGNPSGTAQNTIFSSMLGMLGYSTGHLVGTAVGGAAAYGMARFLASPAGASSLAKYAKAVERANQMPQAQGAAMVNLAHRNLANTVRSLAPMRPNQKQ